MPCRGPCNHLLQALLRACQVSVLFWEGGFCCLAGVGFMQCYRKFFQQCCAGTCSCCLGCQACTAAWLHVFCQAACSPAGMHLPLYACMHYLVMLGRVMLISTALPPSSCIFPFHKVACRAALGRVGVTSMYPFSAEKSLCAEAEAAIAIHSAGKGFTRQAIRSSC